MSRSRLILAALTIGVAVVAAHTVLVTLVTGHPLRFEADVEPFFAVLAAIPFLALAFASANRLLPWLVGLVLTLSIYAYAIYGEVNRYDALATGLIVLLSPLFIGPVVLAVHALQRRASPAP